MQPMSEVFALPVDAPIRVKLKSGGWVESTRHHNMFLSIIERDAAGEARRGEDGVLFRHLIDDCEGFTVKAPN